MGSTGQVAGRQGEYHKMKNNLISTCALFFLIWWPGLGYASQLELTVIAPQEIEEQLVMAGSTIVFTILFTNSGTNPSALTPYENIKLVLKADAGQLETTAKMYPGRTDETVAAKGFMKKTYRFDLPGHMSGQVRLCLLNQEANTILFNALPPVPTEITQEPLPENNSIAVLKDLQHPFYDNFSTYEPIYFLFGIKPGIERSKFQLSFKYRLFTLEENSFFKSNLPWLEKLHFAYTQTSFWDLESDSAPFEDSRYMPEIFYYNDNIDLGFPENLSFGLQTGYQHESNGRGGELSRSTNHLYIKPVFAFGVWEDIYVKIAPKAWIYVNNENENNPDLADYRGYFDLETKLGSVHGLVLETHFRLAEKGPTWQFDISYPLKEIIGFDAVADFNLHMQYFTGYAENLLNYQEREDNVRLGLSLIR